MANAKPDVLVAEVPEVIPLVQEAWQAYFALTFCTSMAEAETLLNKRFDVIVCGPHFAESKMFDLLRMAKSKSPSRRLSLSSASVCWTVSSMVRHSRVSASPHVLSGLPALSTLTVGVESMDLIRHARSYDSWFCHWLTSLSDDFGQPIDCLMAAPIDQFLCLQ